jgi:DNA-binding NtrC family response regulator
LKTGGDVVPPAGTYDTVLEVLAISSDSPFLRSLTRALSRSDLKIVTEADFHSGLEAAIRDDTELVLLDLSLKNCNPFDFLTTMLKVNPAAQVLFITEQYSRESAIEAIQMGAADYLSKSTPADDLRHRFDTFIAAVRTRQNAKQLHGELPLTFAYEGIVGRSPLMLKVFDRIRSVSPHFRNVLVSGATGTGKELVARTLHRLSPGAAGPFVVCNCVTLREGSSESDLLGYVRTSPSGAAEDHPGYFELAQGGTLFLDEIADANLEAQARLVRVLQDHVVHRVGSPAPHEIDLRVVASTNRDLRSMVADKLFREDLYYRMSAVEITLPLLSKRPEDLFLLARQFIERFAAQYNKRLSGMTRKAESVLFRYSWPGNVRELENVLGYACMMAQGDALDVRDLPEWQLAERPVFEDTDSELCSLKEVQRRHVQRVLRHVKDNKGLAAEILGIGRTTLYRMLRSGSND